LFRKKLNVTAQINKTKEVAKMTVYPMLTGSFAIRKPLDTGPIIPPSDCKIPKNPLKKSLVSGSVISNVNTLKASQDRKSTRLNSSHVSISYAVFCLKRKQKHRGAVFR